MSVCVSAETPASQPKSGEGVSWSEASQIRGEEMGASNAVGRDIAECCGVPSLAMFSSWVTTATTKTLSGWPAVSAFPRGERPAWPVARPAAGPPPAPSGARR